MPPKHKKNKNKKSRGGQGGSHKGDDTSLVSWDPNKIMTDKMTIPRKVSTVFSTTKMYAVESVLTTTTVPAYYTPSFTLSLLDPDYSSLAAVFDQYKVEVIEIILTPRITQATSNVTQPGGFLYSCIDYDDQTSLGSIAAIQAYANVIATRMVVPHRRCWKPRMAVATYAGSFGGFGNVPAGWVDTASTSVQFYGVKFACDTGVTSAGNNTWDMQIRSRISFRSSR